MMEGREPQDESHRVQVLTLFRTLKALEAILTAWGMGKGRFGGRAWFSKLLVGKGAFGFKLFLIFSSSQQPRKM